MAAGRDQEYDAEAVACHACAARARAHRAYVDGNGDAAGVYFPISERR